MSTSVASLDALPRNLLGKVAYHLVVDDDGIGRDPSALLPLLMTSKSIHSALMFDEYPQLYYDLYCATFDHAALTRRFNWMAATMAASAKRPPPPGGPGGPGGGNGHGPPGGGDGKGKKMFKLFDDPRSWAIDYRSRWDMARRMKKVINFGKLFVPGVCDREQMTADLWHVWFLLTENGESISICIYKEEGLMEDGKNIWFLANICQFQNWIILYFKDDMLQDSLVPGYPKDTGDKALGMWCSLLSGTDLSAIQSPADIDEKIFTLRPYVFACAKYDITYAPWHHRRLPLADPGVHPITTPSTEGDITVRSKAVPYGRFGYTWRRAPPHFVLGAYLVFFRLLERQPSPNQKSGEASGSGLFSVSRILPSIYHDREWQRNSVCQDPNTSPGLPPLTFMGDLNGYWRGTFLFYDFEMYRQIIAGDIRAVYTSQFSAQNVEMQLKETVIKIRKDQVGGEGPLLDAGFREVGEEQGELEQQRIEAGYGYEIAQAGEVDEEGWTKEILISGRVSWLSRAWCEGS